MSPLDIENIVAREGEERGWSAQTMAHVFALVSDLVGVEREACAKVVEGFAPGYSYVLRDDLLTAIRNRI